MKALSLQPMHGLGISRRIAQVTGGTFKSNQVPCSRFASDAGGGLACFRMGRLGASSSHILKMALSEGMKPVLAGVALGIAGALALTRYLAALLFGVTTSDLATYCAVSLLLIATALIACYLPGRRAMNIDPSTALRIE